MTWKNALHDAIKKEMQPMRQATYWIIFVSVALITTCITVSGASAGSAELIEMYPEIASSSWILQ